MPLNEGQMSLLVNYVQPALDGYFTMNSEPNPENFMEVVINSHPACQEALSHVCAQLWHASYFTYSQSLMSQAREDTKVKGNNLIKSLTKAQNTASQTFVDDASQWLDMRPGYGPQGLQFPGLSPSEFFQMDAEEMPYWWREQQRLFAFSMQGKITHAQLMAEFARLIQATADSPHSSSQPGGYEQYESGTDISQFGIQVTT